MSACVNERRDQRHGSGTHHEPQPGCHTRPAPTQFPLLQWSTPPHYLERTDVCVCVRTCVCKCMCVCGRKMCFDGPNQNGSLQNMSRFTSVFQPQKAAHSLEAKVRYLPAPAFWASRSGFQLSHMRTYPTRSFLIALLLSSSPVYHLSPASFLSPAPQSSLAGGF